MRRISVTRIFNPTLVQSIFKTHQVMKNISQFLLFICFSMLFSCFQNEVKNSENENLSVSPTTENVEKSAEFLSQEMLIKYRDEAKTIEFPYKKFGLGDSLKFNKVIAYEVDGISLAEDGEYHESVYIKDDEYSRKIKNQRELNHKEIEKLLTIFTSEKYFGGMSALCFDPRLGFIFYHNSEVVNVLDICLDCNNVYGKRRFLPFEFYYKHKEMNRGFTGFSTAFNEKGYEGITALCKDLNFEYGNFDREKWLLEE